MASYHGNTNSEPAKNEQIITEFFAKSLHIILESRCPYVSSRNYSGEQGLSSPSSSSSSSSSIRSRDKWFNLALKDCPAALENIDFWRQSNLEPMVVDVVLVQRSSNWDPLNCSPKRALVRKLSSKERYYWNSEHDEFRNEVKSEKIIERWVLQYESRKGSNVGGSGSGSKRWSCTSSHTLYKKSILLLRSLYVTVRLLPAYKYFRDLISSAQIGIYNLGHRVSSFVEPFTHRVEAEMQRFVFAPVDTSCGRICLSVLYRSSVSDVSSEPSTPMSPQFIPDYVGSSMAEPLKRFPSGPLPQGSPPLSPFGRRHSWSYDLYRESPSSEIPSHSPTYSESHATFAKTCSHRLPPRILPRHLPDETPQGRTKSKNYDEYWPSPIFSPSPSPSPPTYSGGIHISKALLQSESAPVSIIASRTSGIPSIFHNQMVPPSPPSRPSKSSLAKTDGRCLVQTSSTVDKLFPFGKDEAAKLSGVKISSNSSLQKSFSRSSSWLSFQDDYDDSEFFGPFVVDEDDVTDPASRPGSFDQLGHPCGRNDPVGGSVIKKSQDAAVGELVCMLKKALPLQQDLCDSTNFMPGSKPEILKTRIVDPNQIFGQPGMQQSASMSFASSALLVPKTTADALEELRGYSEMKNLLLKES